MSSNLARKVANRLQRKNRIRANVSGTTERPRLSIHISARHITAQIIDDTTHKTVTAVSTVGAKAATGTMTEKATWVGAEIAAKARTNKVSRVVFDRSGKQYHGRIKALAEAARAKGLEF